MGAGLRLRTRRAQSWDLRRKEAELTLTYKDVADIIKIIDASGCEEVIVELADVKIVVRRSSGTTIIPTATPLSPAEPQKYAEKPRHAERQIAPSEPPADINATDGGTIVRSPMTGTFYRAPSPKDPPFVEIGSIVKSGDSLCSIEVMKLFTTIMAETDGQVTRVFAQNAELVQVGQPLFKIEAIRA